MFRWNILPSSSLPFYRQDGGGKSSVTTTRLRVRHILEVAGFPPRRPGFDHRSGHVGFVVDKVALGQDFSEYFGFPCQSSFHRLLHNYHHRSFGAGTIGQQWPTYQVDSVSPHPEKLEKKLSSERVELVSSFRPQTPAIRSLRIVNNSEEYHLLEYNAV
jgi:hypothetical protein